MNKHDDRMQKTYLLSTIIILVYYADKTEQGLGD